MITFTIRKNIGIIIVLCILALIYCPGSYIVNFESMYENSYTANQTYGTTAAEYSKYFGYIAMISSALFVLLFNFLNFSFLYKKSSSDVFHAFPLTRTELLLSRMISGIISSFIPIILSSICYIFMMIFNPWIGNFSTLLYYLAITFVIALIWSSFSLLFVVCAGSAFDLSLSFIGVNLASVFIALIFDNILSETLLGYTGSSEQMLYHLSLPYFCFQYKSIKFWILSIIYIAGFTLASVLLYNRRKAEKGGNAYAYKFMYFFCSILAGICGGYFLGSIFDNDITSVIFWLFAIIGALLTCIIYGLITNRGFKGVSRATIMGGIAILTILAVMISGLTGGFGYSKRIPNANSVKEVEVYFLGEYVTFTDLDDITKLHEKAIKFGIKDVDYSEEEQFITIKFDYAIKGGSSLKRSFCVPVEAVHEELLSLYKSEERLNSLKKEISHSPEEYQYIELRYENPLNKDVNKKGYITQFDCDELLAAYWSDVQNLTNVYFYTTFNDENGQFSLEFTNNVNYRSYYFSLNIDRSFSNTISYIENLSGLYIETY